MRRSLNLLSLLIFFSTSAYTQKADEQLVKIEEELIGIYNQILLSEENDERENYNHTFLKSRGFGFVTFRFQKDAQAALFDKNKFIDGRLTECYLASNGKVIRPPNKYNRY